MPLVSVSALILQAFPYSDTSKILRLLTREYGVQSVIAKGALRPKSRFGGVLEPFTEGVASFVLRESRELHTLTGFELIKSRQSLGHNLVHFGGASLVAELVMRVGSEERDPTLFDVLLHALDCIEQAEPPMSEGVVLAQAWSLISHLGFAPALDECISCGRPIEEQEEVIFDYTAGGVRCLECGAGLGGRLVPAAARSILRNLVEGHAVSLERSAAHWRLLSRYLSHHVLEGQILHSLSFLAAATRDAE